MKYIISETTYNQLVGLINTEKLTLLEKQLELDLDHKTKYDKNDFEDEDYSLDSLFDLIKSNERDNFELVKTMLPSLPKNVAQKLANRVVKWVTNGDDVYILFHIDIEESMVKITLDSGYLNGKPATYIGQYLKSDEFKNETLPAILKYGRVKNFNCLTNLSNLDIMTKKCSNMLSKNMYIENTYIRYIVDAKNNQPKEIYENLILAFNNLKNLNVTSTFECIINDEILNNDEKTVVNGKINKKQLLKLKQLFKSKLGNRKFSIVLKNPTNLPIMAA